MHECCPLHLRMGTATMKEDQAAEEAYYILYSQVLIDESLAYAKTILPCEKDKSHSVS